MRITYLGLLPPHQGGIAQHGARLTAALVAAGNTMQRLSWRRPYPSVLYPGDLVDPRNDPAPHTTYPMDWHRPTSWSRGGRAARQGDLVVLPWVTTLHGPATAAMLRAADPTPSVGVVHNALPHERHVLDAHITRWALRRLDGAVVHASSLAQQVSELVPGLPIEVVAHPPNLDLPVRPLPAVGPLRVLVFGVVRAYKGVELALDAAGVLRDRGVDVHLTVAGRFWEPIERWRAEVAARRLGTIVDLDDRYVPDDELPDLFGSHHIVLAPYRSATQSGIVPLAQSAGRPVVATAVGGLVEAVDDGHNGRLVEVGDVHALADALVEVADDLGDLAAASQAAVTRWSDVAAAVMRVAPV